MSHGLKGRVREIVTQMNGIRENPDAPRDINLRQFMAENYSDVNGVALSPENLYSDLGIDPQRTRVTDLYANEDTRYLMNEVVRDGVRRGMGIVQREQLEAIRASLVSVTSDAGAGGQRFITPDVVTDSVSRGAVQSTFYPDLVVRDETVNNLSVTVPFMNLADAVLKDSGEAATIEEGSITYGKKEVPIKKKARAFKIPYEAIEFTPLSLAQLYFEDAGRILGHSLNGMAVEAIINGDQANLSEKAAVIGVKDTAKGIQWFDLARIAIQFGLIGRTGIQAIGNALTALNYIDLPEVKNKQFPGAPLLATILKSAFIMPTELYPSVKVPDNQLVIQDPSMSLVQLTARPLLMETEKIMSKQIDAAYASIYTAFAKLQRNASVVLDGSIPFNGNGFPDWMQPLAD